MHPPVEAAAVQAYLARHLTEVFATMLSLPAEILADAICGDAKERVSGSVGFAGETVTGAVYLHLSATFASQVAAAMLGLKPEEITGETEVNDVVGEATNMLTGGLKSWLCDSGADCAVSTPAIIRGTAFDVEPMPDVERECLVFDCGDDRLVVEIHIKFN